MRWNKSKPTACGEERIVKKFLWLPKTIVNQSRWLEIAYFRQSYVRALFECAKWTDVKWVTEEEFKERICTTNQ